MSPTDPKSEPAGEARTWEIGGLRIMRTEDWVAREAANRPPEPETPVNPFVHDRRPAWMIEAESSRVLESAPAPFERDTLTDHEYDGIQEYDNPTPGWWYLIFGGTAAFAVLYLILLSVVPVIPSPQLQHARAESAYLTEQFSELNKLAMGEEKIRKIMGEEKWLASGRAIFNSTCAICHLSDGSGQVGPNMTDDFYKNTDSLMGFVDVITNGAANGQMPAQKAALTQNEIALVAAYAASLRGGNLPGKPPEGVEIPPFPVPLSADGTPISGDADTP